MPILLTIALKLLSIGSTALAWLKTLPWYVMALAACVAVIAWQHHAETRKDARIAALSATAAQMNAAQAEAARLASEALHHQEQVYQAKAKESDDAYTTQLAAARSAADRYISGHRVRSDGARGASATPASPQGGNPTGPVGPDNHADMVAVSADDINACTVNSTRLQAARDWALGLGQSSSNP